MASAAVQVDPMVLVPFAHREDVLRSYKDDGTGHGGFFIPGYSGTGVGQPLTLEIGFVGEQVAFQTRCVVKSRVARGDDAGSFVAITPDSVRSRDFILQFARGTEPSSRQAHRRFPVVMKVQLVVRGQIVLGRTVNLSEGGAYVELDAAPATGDSIELLLKPTPSSVLSIPSEVMWRGRSPKGIGVMFNFRHPEDTEPVADILNRAREHVIVAF